MKTGGVGRFSRRNRQAALSQNSTADTSIAAASTADPSSNAPTGSNSCGDGKNIADAASNVSTATNTNAEVEPVFPTLNDRPATSGSNASNGFSSMFNNMFNVDYNVDEDAGAEDAQFGSTGAHGEDGFLSATPNEYYDGGLEGGGGFGEDVGGVDRE